MRVAVAVSGGRDSTALLHCTVRGAREIGAQVFALHVNHGLQAAADGWEQHVRRQVARWARSGAPVSLRVVRLAEAPPPGASVEAWARARRYEALAGMAREAGCGAVLLAHHRQDQAETVLLQMLRRSQPGALAGMAARSERDGMVWLRPWLQQSGDAIAAYVQRHGLRFVDDPTNRQTRFARSRLRQSVWPSLVEAFPGAEASLASLAQQVRVWREVVEERVADDLAEVSDAAGLLVRRWGALPAARRELALRTWLSRWGQGVATDALVRRLLCELPAATVGSWPVAGTAGWLSLHRGVLVRHAESPIEPVACDSIDLSRPGWYDLPRWGGRLEVAVSDGPGVAWDDLQSVELRPRAGGERFQAAPGRPARALKKQFQEFGVPAWCRHGPLVWRGADLLFVPGLGIDARFWAASGVGRATIVWHPGNGSPQPSLA